MRKNLVSFVYITAGAWFNHFPNEKRVGLVTNLQKQNRTVATLKAIGHNPQFLNEAKSKTFLVKMKFICMRINNNFHINGLRLRPGATRKWPTCLLRSRRLGRHATPSSKKEGHARARQLSNLLCARAICEVLELLSRTGSYLRVTSLPLVHNSNSLKDPTNMYHSEHFSLTLKTFSLLTNPNP